jgi:cytochrome c-type biogenesis protein CcmH
MHKLILVFCIISNIVFATVELTYSQQQRLYELSAKYRCLVCQGQSLLDSDASFAKDLRYKIAEKIKQNYSDETIDKYLINLYGEAIKLTPNKSNHLILWYAPIWLILIAIFLARKSFK